MSIPYRTRQSMGRFFTALLVITVIFVIAALCWLLWLDRFVVYTRDGAKLDFGVSMNMGGQPAEKPVPGEPVDIYYADGPNAVKPNTSEFQKLTGYSVSEAMLQGDIAALSRQIQLLPTGTPIMLDMKNIRGDFLYNTALGPISDKASVGDIEKMIAELRNKGYYLVARLPALRDYWHGLNNVSHGLFNQDRYSLWMDADRCYWLDPTNEGTLTYLVQIVSELRNLGFDEVVLYDFRFPDTDRIAFEGDRAEAIGHAASVLVKSCSSDTFAVSFGVSDSGFPLPEGRTRLFFQNVAAADAASLAAQSGLDEERLVFLTDLMDTRFDDYGVLRPLPSVG